MASRSSVPSANVLTRKRPAVSSTISILIGFLDIPDELCGAGWVPDALRMNRTHPFSSRRLARQLMIEDLFCHQFQYAVDKIGFASSASRDAIQTDDVSACGCSSIISPPSDDPCGCRAQQSGPQHFDLVGWRLAEFHEESEAFRSPRSRPQLRRNRRPRRSGRS
jgi:hypothetical protein